jgi:beta-lactamase regulating signal transducer with metallopeptidase domain
MSDLAGLQVVTQLESFGRGLVERFGPLNLWTAALLGGAFVLDRALTRRARASWRIALYAPVALRVALPLDWNLQIANAPSVASFLAPRLQRFGSPAAVEASSLHAPSWYALAAVVYVAAVALLVARALRARLRVGRALVGAEPAPGLDSGVSAPVVQHEELGPMVVGLLAPRIVLPRRLLAKGEERALACVLRHETAHLRRHDAWLSAAMQVLAVMAWPVVPMWIAIARVRQLVELACDEAALAGADADERRRYGHALLDMAEWRSFAVAPVGAGELHFGSTLRARIEALAAQRRWPIAAQALALSVAPFALIAACGGSAPPTAAVPTSAAPAPSDDDTGYGYEFAVDLAKNGGASPAADLTLPHAKGDRIPPETVQAILRSHYGAFNACYAAGLERNPALAGVVSVRFVAGTDGATKQVLIEKVTSDAGDVELADKDVGTCVAREVAKVSYAPGGGIMTVVYPIRFTP